MATVSITQNYTIRKTIAEALNHVVLEPLMLISDLAAATSLRA